MSPDWSRWVCYTLRRSRRLHERDTASAMCAATRAEDLRTSVSQQRITVQPAFSSASTFRRSRATFALIFFTQ